MSALLHEMLLLSPYKCPDQSLNIQGLFTSRLILTHMMRALDRSATPPPPYEYEPKSPARNSWAWELRLEPYECTRPAKQFKAQVAEETRKINALVAWFDEDEPFRKENNLESVKVNEEWSVEDNAEFNVKQRWIALGLWNPRWNEMGYFGRWKHEELDRPDDYELHEDFPEVMQEHAIKTAKSSDPSDMEDADASRPYRQLQDQIAHERIWQKEFEATFCGDDHPEDDEWLDKRATDRVLERWIEWGIWDSTWRDVPGSNWKHEHIPLRDWMYSGFEYTPGERFRIERFRVDRKDDETLTTTPAQTSVPESEPDLDSKQGQAIVLEKAEAEEENPIADRPPRVGAELEAAEQDHARYIYPQKRSRWRMPSRWLTENAHKRARDEDTDERDQDQSVSERHKHVKLGAQEELSSSPSA